MPFSLSDILAGYGGSPDPENPSSGEITPGLLLRALQTADVGGSQAYGKMATDIATLPRRAIEGAATYQPGLRREDITDIPGSGFGSQPADVAVGPATEAGMTLMGVGTGFAQPGSAGIFGGRLAKNAPLDKYAIADEMVAKGAKREPIFKATGLTLGKDLQLRHEISDAAMKFTPLGEEAIANRTTGLTAGQVIDHPELFAAYPDLANFRVNFTDPIAGSKSFGGIDKANKTLYLNPDAFEPEFLANYSITPEQVRRGVVPGLAGMRSTGLHELQHMVQEAEGHAAGGNIFLPEVQKAADRMVAKQARDYHTELSGIIAQRDAYIREQQLANRPGTPSDFYNEWQIQNRRLAERAAELKYKAYQAKSQYNKGLATQEAYQNLAGETESRNTQYRRDLTAEERAATPAWKTQDVPYAQQLLRFTDPYGNTISGAEASLRRATRQEDLRPGVLGQKVPSQGSFDLSSEVPSFSERMGQARDVAQQGRNRGGGFVPRSTRDEPPLLAPGETRGDLVGALTPGMAPAETSIADLGRNAYRGFVPPTNTPPSIADIGQRSYRERLGLRPRNLELSSELPPEMGDVTGPAMGVGAPYLRNPNAPLFDYARLGERIDTPQFGLQRTLSTDVQPDYLRAGRAANVARVNRIVEQGIKEGGLDWHGMTPLLDEYAGELGSRAGPAAFNTYMDRVGATSPNSKVGQNFRTASYYDYLLRNGLPLPELLTSPKGNPYIAEGAIPYPYGNKAQGLHVMNLQGLESGAGYPLSRPKPPSFAENMKGNYFPVAIDRHNLKLWGIDSPEGANLTGYRYLEELQQEQARRMGILPGQYQAAGWLPFADSGAVPALKLFEQRIAATAEQAGLTKAQVLREFIRGQMPLR